MKIIHYLPAIDFKVGGPVRAVLDLCVALSENGHDVTLLTRDDRDAPDWTHRGRPKLSLLAGSLPGGLLPASAIREARLAIQASDVLHVHGAWTPSNLQLAAAARKCGKPYIVSPRGMLDDWPMSQKPMKKRLFHKLVGARFLKQAAFIHCTADDELRQSSKWFPRDKGRVIPNLLDLDPYRALPSSEIARAAYPALNGPRPALLFLSRIHVKKGIEHLISAGAVLKERGRPCSILIAGTGDPAYVQSLMRLAEREGVSDQVSFLGMVVDEPKLSLYRASDIFVLPTFQENFGFVLIESLAAGTPVVTTKGVGIWREIESSGGGRILDNATPDTVADAILAVLDGGPEPMGVKGREWVFDALDPKKLLARFEALYGEASP